MALEIEDIGVDSGFTSLRVFDLQLNTQVGLMFVIAGDQNPELLTENFGVYS